MTTEQARTIANLSHATHNGEVTIVEIPKEFAVVGVRHSPQYTDGPRYALISENGDIVLETA